MELIEQRGVVKMKLNIGDKVRTKREFSGVPSGTIGAVCGIDNIGTKDARYAIEWQDLPQYKSNMYYKMTHKKLIDWFAEDELIFLEMIK
jgi:hypothetical protein